MPILKRYLSVLFALLISHLFAFESLAGPANEESERIPNNLQTEFTQPSALNFSDVTKLINDQNIKNPVDLLSRLPESYRKHYTFLYKSHSLQPASPEFPRQRF
jgi:hypothetical protein